MSKSKLFSGYHIICIAIVLLVGSGCFVTKEKYRLKEMELAKTEKEYNTLKEKTEEYKQKLAGLVKEKESLEAKFNTSEENRKELSAQIDKLTSQIKQTEARLNEQRSKADALEKERDKFANIVKTIKDIVSDIEVQEEKVVEKIHPGPEEQPAKDKSEDEYENPPASAVEKEGEKPKGAAEADVSSDQEPIIEEPPGQEPSSEATQ